MSITRRLTVNILRNALLLTMAAFNLRAWGQAGWRDLGLPSRGGISALRHSGAALLAGTSSGRIFRSADAGNSWSMVYQDRNPRINDFLFQDAVVLAASGSGVDLNMLECNFPCDMRNGLYRSADGGRSWNTTGLMDDILSLASGGGSAQYALGLSRLYRSTDKGLTWKPLAVSPSHGRFSGGMAYLGGALYLSIVNGDRKDLYRGVPKGDSVTLTLSHPEARALLASPPYLFASDGKQLLRTRNGLQWETVAGEEYANLSVWGKSLIGVVAATREGRISTDSGRTWKPLPVPLQEASLLRGEGGNLFAVRTSGGVSVLPAGASAWKEPAAGIYDDRISGVALRYQALLAFTAGSGVFQAAGNGGAWHRTWPGEIGTKPLSVGDAIYMLDGHFLRVSRAAAPEKWDSLAPCEGCKALIGGPGWQAAFFPNNSRQLCESGSCLTVSPRLPLPWELGYPHTRIFNAVRAAASHGDTILALLDSLYRSPDRGLTWTLLGAGPSRATVLAFHGQTWYSAPADSGAYLTSRDAGATWNRVGAGPGHRSVNAMAFRSGEVYLGTDSGVFLYRDSGSARKQLGPGSGAVTSLVVEGDRLLAGMASGAVMMPDLEPLSMPGGSKRSISATGRKPEIRRGMVFSDEGWLRLDGRSPGPFRHPR